MSVIWLVFVTRRRVLEYRFILEEILVQIKGMLNSYNSAVAKSFLNFLLMSILFPLIGFVVWEILRIEKKLNAMPIRYEERD